MRRFFESLIEIESSAFNLSPLGWWDKNSTFMVEYPFLSSQDMQRIFAQIYHFRLSLSLSAMMQRRGVSPEKEEDEEEARDMEHQSLESAKQLVSHIFSSLI